MSMTTIGTCGNCGGPVQCPQFWGGSEPPPKKCARCGATPDGEFGPVLAMKPQTEYRKKRSAYDLRRARRNT